MVFRNDWTKRDEKTKWCPWAFDEERKVIENRKRQKEEMRKEEEIIIESGALKRGFIIWDWIGGNKKHWKRGTNANSVKFYEIARSNTNHWGELNWKVLKRTYCIMGIRRKTGNSGIKFFKSRSRSWRIAINIKRRSERSKRRSSQIKTDNWALNPDIITRKTNKIHCHKNRTRGN